MAFWKFVKKIFRRSQSKKVTKKTVLVDSATQTTQTTQATEALHAIQSTQATQAAQAVQAAQTYARVSSPSSSCPKLPLLETDMPVCKKGNDLLRQLQKDSNLIAFYARRGKSWPSRQNLPWTVTMNNLYPDLSEFQH